MTNPFENDEATYLVLINEEGQHSLWPSFMEVPRGWRTAHPADSRRACLEYVERQWTDMRPRSLIDEMKADEQGTTGGPTETETRPGAVGSAGTGRDVALEIHPAATPPSGIGPLERSRDLAERVGFEPTNTR